MRPRLSDVTLDRPRRIVRRTGFGLLLAAAVAGVIGYVVPAHSVDGGAWHAFEADGGSLPLCVLVGFALVTAALARLRFGAGMVAGALAVVAAIASVQDILLVHLLSRIEHGPGEALMAFAVLTLILGGLGLMIAEPIIYLTQRRSDERALRVEVHQVSHA